MTLPNKLHILIAEDDIDDAETIFECFDNHPLFSKVDLVANGKELLDFLENPNGKPDVILTDINMPIINGIEALTKINENPLLHDIPAFVYSTAINPVYASQCEALGTKAFLIKPFTLAGFNDIPNKILAVLGLG